MPATPHIQISRYSLSHTRTRTRPRSLSLAFANTHTSLCALSGSPCFSSFLPLTLTHSLSLTRTHAHKLTFENLNPFCVVLLGAGRCRSCSESPKKSLYTHYMWHDSFIYFVTHVHGKWHIHTWHDSFTWHNYTNFHILIWCTPSMLDLQNLVLHVQYL